MMYDTEGMSRDSVLALRQDRHSRDHCGDRRVGANVESGSWCCAEGVISVSSGNPVGSVRRPSVVSHK